MAEITNLKRKIQSQLLIKFPFIFLNILKFFERNKLFFFTKILILNSLLLYYPRRQQDPPPHQATALMIIDMGKL